jgi:hypothetical protein
MKRVFVALLLMLGTAAIMPNTASAQFDLSKLGGMLSGSTSKPKQSPYKSLAENAPTKSKIVGEWRYNSFDIEYLGNNSFAETAIAQIKSYARMELQQVGATPACFSITLRSNYKGSFHYGDSIYEGGYTYDESSAHFELKATAENGNRLNCNGFLKMVDGKLAVMLAAEDAMRAITAIIPEAQNDSTFLSIKSAVESFPGIYITVLLNR